MVEGQGEVDFFRSKSCNNNITSFLFFNFPDSWSRDECWRMFEKYGVVKDVYLARKRLSSGQRFGFVRFEGIRDIDCFVKVLNNIQIHGRWVRVFQARDRKMGSVGNHVGVIGKETMKIIHNPEVQNDNLASNSNIAHSKISKWEGRSYIDIVKGSNMCTPKPPSPACNRIEINIGGKCIELNLPDSVKNHNLVFSYNHDRFSWTLVEVNRKPLKVDDLDDIKRDVGIKSMPHGSKVLPTNSEVKDVDVGVLSPAKTTKTTDVAGKLVEGTESPFESELNENIKDTMVGSHVVGDQVAGEPVMDLCHDGSSCLHLSPPEKSSVNSHEHADAFSNSSNISKVESQVSKETDFHSNLCKSYDFNCVQNIGSMGPFGACDAPTQFIGPTESNLHDPVSKGDFSGHRSFDSNKINQSVEFCRERKKSCIRGQRNMVKVKHHFFHYIMGKKQTKRVKHRDGLRWCERFTLNRMMKNMEEVYNEEDESPSSDVDS